MQNPMSVCFITEILVFTTFFFVVNKLIVCIKTLLWVGGVISRLFSIPKALGFTPSTM